MEVFNCFWEKRNLGCSAVEVLVDMKDRFCVNDFISLQNYDYIVVKVPVNKLDFNFGLSNLGYVMFEMQMDMHANMNSFNFQEKNIKRILPNISFEEIKSKDVLDKLLSKITPGMFSTDRISLDPFFGMERGCNRYINWIRDEFVNDNSKTIYIVYKGKNVGFATFKVTQELIKGLIGGLFPDYQNDGIGLLTPCVAPLYAKINKLSINKIINPISSNNKAVWDLYEYFGFKPHRPHYVFIKHNNI